MASSLFLDPLFIGGREVLFGSKHATVASMWVFNRRIDSGSGPFPSLLDSFTFLGVEEPFEVSTRLLP